MRFSKAARCTAVLVAVPALALSVASGTAFASSDGLNTANCSGSMSYSSTQVTGYVHSLNGTFCIVSITQNGGSYKDAGTTGGTVSTPTYWHGWASNGTYLTDQVCVYDSATGQEPCASE